MSPSAPAPVPTTTLDTYDHEAVLLDVREPGEWAAGHAPGALHIPLGQLQDRIADIPPGDLVVTCKKGGRAARATAALVAAGRRAANLEGGMEGWHDAGLPMVSENGQEPRVL